MMRMISGMCMTLVQYDQGIEVRIRAINGSKAWKPTAAMKAIEWLRVSISGRTDSRALWRIAESALPKLTAAGKEWPLASRSVVMH